MLDELNHNPTSENVGPVTTSTDVDAGNSDNESYDTRAPAQLSLRNWGE